ncbi:MAG: Asp/Glu racemase [Rhodospirillaceae bacterium]|jgi:maleate isomerase|nr:Asp/Glu racemase [Rhodospirillaceae bacterium]MBT4488091.1 Asp/Glu racemase [Rhodospirillaceae bacterium]MBT5895180.1 Asp/Glu racemase [Rhodospirillaceae bacterium]MBT6430079.1 Asp/Glu racemase [Rhodospirillaceae bacterium]MBT7757814.1 Asp/Glu racemase [Rhodospirillaceae bacterium]
MALDFETGPGWGDATTLGLVILQADETIEQEFRQLMTPEQFSLYHSRIPSGLEVTGETLAEMEAALPAAVDLLPVGAKLDVIGYACTSAAAVIGEDRVGEIIRAVRPGVATTNPLTAVKAALKALGVRRLGFLTPYVAEVSQAMRRRLEDNGIEIAAFGSFEQSEEALVARITPPSILEAIVQIGQGADCDGVFAACTNLRTLDILAEAESRLQKPVVSSNQALAWHMAQLAGRPLNVTGRGRLLEISG